MVYTFVLLAALLGQAPEYTIQHFDSPQECVEAGATIVQAYRETFPVQHILAKCIPGYEV